MPYSLEGKLVVAVASRALFDLDAENALFDKDGDEAAYMEHQRTHERDPLKPGIAFHFVKRLLTLTRSASPARVGAIVGETNLRPRENDAEIACHRGEERRLFAFARLVPHGAQR